MFFITKCVKFIFLLFVFYSMLFAQLPDPFNPIYDFEKHVLSPETAKEMHVFSCKIFHNGKFLKKIVYNGNGHVIEDDKGKYLYEYKQEEFSVKHDMGRIWHLDEYDPDYNQISSATYYYNNNSTVSRIKKDFKGSESEEMVEFAYYQDGPLGVTMVQTYHKETNELIHIKTELAYIENKKLDAFKRTKTVYFASSQIPKYSFTEIYRYKNGRVDVWETRYQNTDGSTEDKNYQYSYDKSGYLSKIQLISDSGNLRDVNAFNFDDQGLLKSQKNEYGEYTYEYDFMKTAHVNIEIKDNIVRPKFYQYQFDYANRILDNTPNTWHLDIYAPGLEIFILRLSEYVEFPLFIEPEKTANIVYANGEFQKINNDPANNLVWEIEKTMNDISYYIDDEENPDEAWNEQMKIIDEKMHENGSSPVFIYYSSIFDLTYIENDEFDDFSDMLVGPEDRKTFLKDYAKDMIRRYPYNPTVIRQFADRK